MEAVALDTPLNRRQIDVLTWIRDGCPDRRWPDHTFKTTAQALDSRRLVTISKRGGTWKAAILPAGQHYLSTGKYPPGHWARRRSSAADLKPPVKTWVATTQPLVPASDATETLNRTTPAQDGLTPTRKLLKDIVDAGGILEIDTSDDNTRYSSLVGIINRRGMAPDGQEVILIHARYNRIILRLSSVSDWKTDPPSETVAAERIVRWYKAVATLRSEKRLDAIGKEQRSRAFRLLHALAREAESRGYTVRLPQRNRNGYIDDRSRLSGDLIIVMPDIECSLDIWQPKDRVPHTPTAYELERQKKYGWPPSQYDHVPANRLSMTIDTNSRYSSKVTWAETKTLKLEQRLPDAFITFERWAVIHAEATEAARLAAIEEQKRKERQDELATQAYVKDALGKRFVADVDDWELSARLRSYLIAMAERVELIDDPDERSAAEEWLAWCREFAAERDPLTRPVRKPKVKPPDYSELQEFRSRLGFGSRFW